MGYYKHIPGHWMLECPDIWNKLTDAVDNAVEELDEDAQDENPFVEGECVDRELVAEMLEWIAKCYREGLMFDGSKQKPRVNPDDGERI